MSDNHPEDALRPDLLLRRLATSGHVAITFRQASIEVRGELRRAAYEVAWPIVFMNVTRGMERRRGHHACASGVGHLADECLDRFHDDVEAVVDDLLSHADAPIRQMEAWITSRLKPVTIDANRRRRGERGALQRPRLPRWLVQALDDDRWLKDLAIQILTWVGVATAAGNQLWPLDAWTQRRIEVTGDWTVSDPAAVEREVEWVLAAMATHPKWYADHVERPLGLKQAPVASITRTVDGPTVEPVPLQLTPAHQVDEGRLLALADAAVEAIRERLRRGEDPDRLVTEVIGSVFGAAPPGADLDRLPHAAPGYDERVSALLGNPVDRLRIVQAVLAVLDEGGPTALLRPA